MSSEIRRAICTSLTVANIFLTLPTAASAQDAKPICPDRPGRGTSPCTLEEGRAQLELGLFDDSYHHRSGVTTDTDNVYLCICGTPPYAARRILAEAPAHKVLFGTDAGLSDQAGQSYAVARIAEIDG